MIEFLASDKGKRKEKKMQDRLKLKLASVCDEENRQAHAERRKNGENERQIKI